MAAVGSVVLGGKFSWLVGRICLGDAGVIVEIAEVKPQVQFAY